MVDRKARDELAAALRAYMTDEVTAFEFDDRIFAIADTTTDETVGRVVLELWHYYDDVFDHKVHASTALWKYFQRALLLLESDVEIEITRRRRWTARQSIALAGTMIFALTCAKWGLSWQPLLLAPILGTVDRLLERWREHDDSLEPSRSVQLIPFWTLADIRRARREVPYFVRVPFRPEIRERCCRSPQSDATHDTIYRAIMLMLGPVCLLTRTFAEVVEVRRPSTA